MRLHPRLLFAVISGLCWSLNASGAGSRLVEAGIPALSREWTGDDYARVAEVLATKKLPLPRLTDEEGKKFIEQLTSVRNFSLFQNASLPIEVRLGS